jgi:hypothetical protein
MKLCINCKHNEREMWCIAPINGVSPVDGRVNPSFASVARGNSALSNGCGIDALHFEQKPPPVRIFYPGGECKSIEKPTFSPSFLSRVYQKFGRCK